MSFKIAFIGAGSLGFTRRLIADLLAVPEFRDIEVAMNDISATNLDLVYQLCKRDIEANGLNIKILKTTDRREAVRGARYIFNTVRIGGLDAFIKDVDIPLKYGVDQCVGDTLCAGGISYGQRGVAFMLGLCKDIREVAEPDALLLNYANPNAMMTWAAIKYGKVNCVGLCHGVQGGRELIARCLKIPAEELDIICAGINHQTWYIKLRYKGEDMMPKVLEAMQNDEKIKSEGLEKARIDMLKHFGCFSTESNGHLSEYLPWYRKNLSRMNRWTTLHGKEWGEGETRGCVRACLEIRSLFETEFSTWMAEDPLVFTQENRSLEHGAYIIEGLEHGKTYRGHFNVMNNGIISNLPDDCIIEAPGYVDALGINIPMVGDLPVGCAAVCSASIWTQHLSVDAAVNGDVMLLRQAMMMDPLTGACLDPDEIDQLVDELLVAQAEWLPQYADEIPKAKKRLADNYEEPRFVGFKGALTSEEQTLEWKTSPIKAEQREVSISEAVFGFKEKTRGAEKK